MCLVPWDKGSCSFILEAWLLWCPLKGTQRDRVGPGMTCLGLGVNSDLSTFPFVPTVPVWLSHGEAGDVTCAR